MKKILILICFIASFISSYAQNDDEDTVCPVTLLYLKVNPFEDKNILTWATAMELNNDYFEIQKSVDGVYFEPIGNVDGNGTYNQIICYAYADVQTNAIDVYYRLKQVDYDGEFEYSPIVMVANTTYKLSVYPNPANDKVTVIVPNGSGILQITDIYGKLYGYYPVYSYSMDIWVDYLPKGIYYLSNENYTQKLIIK